MGTESRHLAVMFIDLGVGLTFIECYHSTSPLLASTLAAWYIKLAIIRKISYLREQLDVFH